MDGRDMGGRDMDGQWMTYTEAAARLGVTPEAVRRRAFRSSWARQPGNDGRTRVRVPDDVPVTRSPTARPDGPALVLALEAHIATLKTDIERLTAELAGERTARQADQEQHQDQLAAERAARQTDREHAAARQTDQEQQLAAERTARQTDQERHQDQLVAARAAADRATAELVELARRLAAIAETQTSAETAEAEPEPPRRSAVGRAWRWFLRN
jgi:hypothetical protein